MGHVSYRNKVCIRGNKVSLTRRDDLRKQQACVRLFALCFRHIPVGGPKAGDRDHIIQDKRELAPMYTVLLGALSQGGKAQTAERMPSVRPSLVGAGEIQL